MAGEDHWRLAMLEEEVHCRNYVTRPHALPREEQHNDREIVCGGVWGTCSRSSYLRWIDQVTTILVGWSLTGFESPEFVAGGDRFFSRFFL